MQYIMSIVFYCIAGVKMEPTSNHGNQVEIRQESIQYVLMEEEESRDHVLPRDTQDLLTHQIQHVGVTQELVLPPEGLSGQYTYVTTPQPMDEMSMISQQQAVSQRGETFVSETSGETFVSETSGETFVSETPGETFVSETSGGYVLSQTNVLSPHQGTRVLTLAVSSPFKMLIRSEESAIYCQ